MYAGRTVCFEHDRSGRNTTLAFSPPLYGHSLHYECSHEKKKDISYNDAFTVHAVKRDTLPDGQLITNVYPVNRTFTTSYFIADIFNSYEDVQTCTGRQRELMHAFGTSWPEKGCI